MDKINVQNQKTNLPFGKTLKKTTHYHNAHKNKK